MRLRWGILAHPTQRFDENNIKHFLKELGDTFGYKIYGWKLEETNDPRFLSELVITDYKKKES